MSVDEQLHAFFESHMPENRLANAKEDLRTFEAMGADASLCAEYAEKIEIAEFHLKRENLVKFNICMQRAYEIFLVLSFTNSSDFKVGKKLNTSRKNENEKKINNSFKARFGAMAQSMADELHREKPSRPFTTIRKLVLKELEKKGIPGSDSTLKKSIKNPNSAK